MFTGTWKESQQSLIKLEIPDENIDEEGMAKRLTGSLLIVFRLI